MSRPLPPPHTGLFFVGKIHNDIYPAIDPLKTDLSQPKKVVLITGAGRGIGRAIAIEYAKANVAHIILAARTLAEITSVEENIQEINPNIKITKLPLDISDQHQVKTAFQIIKDDIGRLDILINNAGTGEKWVPLIDSDPEDWWRSFEVMIKGTYLMLRSFLPLLIDTAEKEKTVVDVVNMSSIGAHIPIPDSSSYNTTKFALLRLTEFVNLEYGGRGVNCVALHPGGVVTELSKDVPHLKGFLNDTAGLAGGFTVWLTKGQRTWLAGRYLAAAWDVDDLEKKKEEIVERDLLKVRMAV